MGYAYKNWKQEQYDLVTRILEQQFPDKKYHHVVSELIVDRLFPDKNYANNSLRPKVNPDEKDG